MDRIKFIRFTNSNPIRTQFYTLTNWIGDSTSDINWDYDLGDCIEQSNNDLYPVSQYPPVDVFINEESQDLKFQFALSGYSKDPKITFEEDFMYLEMEKEELEGDSWLPLNKGISTKKFKTQYFVPSKKYDFGNVKAEWKEKGLLEIVIPAKEEAKPRQIQINNSRK